MTQVWVYHSRRGDNQVFEGTRAGFDLARKLQDKDNGMTLKDIIRDSSRFDFGGTYDEGHFWIDDGGSIELFNVIEGPRAMLVWSDIAKAYRCSSCGTLVFDAMLEHSCG